MRSDPLADAPAVTRLTAQELSRCYALGELTPAEVVRTALERAYVANRRFNAFVHIDADGAMAAAEVSTLRWKSGAPLSVLDGVPATIKDILWVRDWPISFGTSSVPATRCTEDAPAVGRMRSAGLVFLGTTTTPEFGWKAVTDSPAFGITRNPCNPDLTSGGSSGGAAVAAATGVAPLNLGTDGGGSIRIPAAFCGVVGLKPSFGRVPAYPPSAFGSLAHIGPIARSVADVRAMLSVISGRDIRDWAQGPASLPPLEQAAIELKGLRAGYWDVPASGAADPAVTAVVHRALAHVMRETGMELAPVELPEGGTRPLFECLWFAGAANRLQNFDSASRIHCDKGLLEIVGVADGITARELAGAHEQRAAFGARMDELLKRFTVIISPATAVAPFEAGREVPVGSGWKRWTEWAGFSYPVNLSQQPACVVPCGFLPDDRPVALQIVGERGADATVLQVAEALEAILTPALTQDSARMNP